MTAIDVYNFAYASIYTNDDMIASEKVREKVKKYPRLVMLMVYLDYIDKIFERQINGLDKLWYLVSLKDELKDKIYSDDHYNFMNNAAQYYRYLTLSYRLYSMTLIISAKKKQHF